MTSALGNSSAEQALLRTVALWVAPYAEEALPLFERHHPNDLRPRDAIRAARIFGEGKQRDKALRMAAFAAMKAANDADEVSKCAARAAMLTAAIAYTHTDLQRGEQGVRQAQHILGPIVYAARAIELANETPDAANDLIKRAVASAPPEVHHVLEHMPPQPHKTGRLAALFSALDTSLRQQL